MYRPAGDVASGVPAGWPRSILKPPSPEDGRGHLLALVRNLRLRWWLISRRELRI
jgi:hypothetical protein